MPSSVQQLDYSRSFTFQLEDSPRYGNFQNLDHLPAVGKGARAGEHYIPYFTNKHIFKTVSSWTESWQPWQQRVLLCGIADRLPLRQIDVLATTLEPVNHRDYVTACRRQYPSTPFRSKRVEQQGNDDHSSHNYEHLDKIDSLPACEAKVPETKSPEVHSMSSQQVVPDQIPERQAKNAKSPCHLGVPEGSRETTLSPLSYSLQEFAKATANQILESVLQHVTEGKTGLSSIADEEENELEAPSGQNDALQPECCTQRRDKVYLVGDNEFKTHTSPCKSDSVIENVLSNNQALDVELDVVIPSSGISKESPARSSSSGLSMGSPQSPVRPVTNRLSHSIDYIADQKEPRLSKSHCTSYSPFKNHLGYFHVNTPDFFSKRPGGRLGPFQTSLDLNTSDRKCQSDCNVHIPLHLTYKNAKWWAEQPQAGRTYLRARKRELLPHFKQQLQQIWQWLDMWTDFERVAFVKEIIKVSGTDVLSTFASYIQQRLRDERDINRLPDQLLLQVFSQLSPPDISSCAQVCRRWRYLCASDSLWMVKCHQMGEKEGLGNVNDIVMKVGQGQMGVDWRKAYRELERIAINAKTGISPLARTSHFDDTDLVVNELNTVVQKRRQSDDSDVVPDGASAIAEDVKVKAGTESMILRSRRQAAVLEDSDSDVSEDLIPLMTDYNYYSADALKAKKRWSDRRGGLKKLPPSLVQQAARGDNPDGLRWAEGPRPLEPVTKTEPHKSKDEDLAYDIRPQLRHCTDLLGKTRASRSLEWETPAQGQDQMAEQLPFAGQVMGIKRVRNLVGHSGGVLCVHSDQRRLASGGWDRTIRLWDVRSGRSLHKFFGHRGGIHSLVFDNDIMVSGSWDMTIMGHSGGVLCVHSDQRRLASGGWDRTIRLWDVRSGRSLHKFFGHRGGIHSLVFDNDIMVSGSWDMTIMVWCMKKFTRRLTLHDHKGCVSCLVLHPQFIVSGSHDTTIRVYHRNTLLCYKVITGHTRAVNCVAFDGEYVLSGSADRTLRLTNIHTLQLMQVFEGMQEAVLSVLSRGSLLIGGDSLGRVYFWNKSTGESEAAIQAHDGPVNSIGFWGNRLLTASGDCSIKEWDFNTMTAVRCLDGHKGAINQMKVSEKRIVSCSEDGNVRVWDTFTPNQLKKSKTSKSRGQRRKNNSRST